MANDAAPAWLNAAERAVAVLPLSTISSTYIIDI
jgi:hypothetical protein